METLRKEVNELRASHTIDQRFLASLEADELMKNMYGQLLSTRADLEKERRERTTRRRRITEHCSSAK